MKRETVISSHNESLRKKAEKKLKILSKTELKEFSAEDAARLIHELRIHQIELEMQNEELKRAHNEIEESRAKYSDLYDFAPVGYFTFDKNGLILEANLTGAGLLGIERGHLIKKPFSQYVGKDNQDIFFLHRRKVFDTKERQTCEIKIKRKNAAEFYAQLESMAVKDSAGNFSQCRTVVTDISRRRRFMEEVIESETRFRTLFEQAGVGVAQIISRTGQFVRINKRYCDIVGYSRQEMEKLTFQEITHPDDLQADLNNMRLLLKGKIKGFSMEKRYFHKNGSLVWVNLTVSPMWRAGEEPYYHIAVVEDITARKKAEEALYRIEWLLKKSLKSGARPKYYGQPYGKLSELNTYRVLKDAVTEDMLFDIVYDYLDLLDTSSAVYEKNGDYAMGIFSSGWCRFLDNASRRLCGTRDNRRALAGGKWHCHESCWTDASKPAIESGKPVDIECRGGIRLYAVPIRAGSEIMGSINFGYGDPPTDHGKLLEIAERYSVSADELAEHARAYESRPPFIIDIAKRRLVTSANLIGEIVKRCRIENDLQRSKDELRMRVEERTADLKDINLLLKQEIDEHKKTEKALENAKAEIEAWNRELEKRVKDKTDELLNAQAQMIQSEKLAVMGELVGGLAHELNSPLAGLLPLLKAFRARAEKGSEDHKELSLMTNAAEHMARILKNFGVFSRKSKGIFTTLSLNEVIEDTLSFSEVKLRHKGIKIKKDLGGSLPLVKGDKTGLQQVVLNMVTNACDAMDEGGIFVIKTDVSEDNRRVIMEFTDNGAGIDKENINKIFDPFFTTKISGEGIGLGLSVSYDIIKKHNGEIKVESKPGKGTRFSISLPAVNLSRSRH